MATQLQFRRGTTSETGSFTGAVGEVTVDTTKDTLVVHDGSTAGGHEMAKADGSNISFGDNVKAKFGAGSDLQIYHDGSGSYVSDQGTGPLKLLSNGLQVKNAADNENIIVANQNGAVTLYHDNSAKLATTSSGIDVTGSVTSDGLNVDGTSVLDSETNFVADTSASNKSLVLASQGATGGTGQLGASLAFSRINSESPRAAITAINTDSNFERMGLSFWTHQDNYENVMKKRMVIDHEGDISFYEDTGTTPKFFWDASAESLGIGNSSPLAKAHISYTTQATANREYGLVVNGDDSGTVGESASILLGAISSKARGASISAEVQSGSNDHDLIFATSGPSATPTERLRIDSSGNVGIGTDSPSRKLSVNSDSFQIAAVFESSSPNSARISLKDANTTADNYVSVAAIGDALAFYSGGAERARITSGGNFGIGTSSPSSPLHVSKSVENLATFTSSDTGARIVIADNTDTGYVNVSSGIVSLGHTIGLSGNNLNIDSSGRVGIGTISPSAPLTVSTSSTTNVDIKTTATNGTAQARFSNDARTYSLGIDNNDSFFVYDATGTSTRLTVTSSGNLLVAKTSSSTGTAGFEARANGQTVATVDGGTALIANRKTSDGDVIRVLKGGSLVGSIGAESGNVYIQGNPATGKSGLTFYGSYIEPRDNGASADAAVDLGISSARFKDLYLSGDVALTNSYVFGDTDGLNLRANSGKVIKMQIAGSEKARIDSSGNLLVGTSNANPTSSSVNDAGVELSDTGGVRSTVASNPAATFNRKTDDGDIALFRKNGGTVAVIGVNNGDNAYIGATASGHGGFYFGNTNVAPMAAGTRADDTVDLGTSAHRWDDIYASNGTIQTSDRNEKQDIEALSDAEQRVAVAAKGLLRKFRWKSAVEEKGDDARIHFGIIAQDLQDAFTAEGLDAGRYAMFISSTWTDEETGEERTRLGVRYSELLAFIISAI